MGKKVKQSNVFVLAVAVLLIGSVIGIAGTYYWTQTEVDTAFSRGMAYQQTIDVAKPPASVTATLTSGTFVHTATIAADGSAAAEVDVTDTLTIENTDEARSAEEPTYITLYNPITDRYGLHDNLETDSTEFSITVGGATYKLYHDGAYIVPGYEIPGGMSPGGEIAVTLTFTVETAVAGTFQDGQSYTNYMYIYQKDASYADVVSFIVTT
jgi:hypothetical protein